MLYTLWSVTPLVGFGQHFIIKMIISSVRSVSIHWNKEHPKLRTIQVRFVSQMSLVSFLDFRIVDRGLWAEILFFSVTKRKMSPSTSCFYFLNQKRMMFIKSRPIGVSSSPGMEKRGRAAVPHSPGLVFQSLLHPHFTLCSPSTHTQPTGNTEVVSHAFYPFCSFNDEHPLSSFVFSKTCAVLSSVFSTPTDKAVM